MSFSNDVREEIARSITDRDRQFACLYGILLYSRIFTQEQVVLQSESPVFARLMPMLFRAVFRTELQPDVRTISAAATSPWSAIPLPMRHRSAAFVRSITFVRKSGRSVFPIW